MDFWLTRGGKAMIGLLASLAYLIPLTGGLILFKLDERKADAVMLASFISALVAQLGVAYLFLTEHHEVIHIPYITTERLGEPTA
ncbi:hypothetical protein [Thermococcus peptonophilus]|uniref:hypothetical protein n=1 Tax=Thermococcus peptonophilus TaxID=53952 RepID=UPI003466D246